jgi:hypothetical protein
MRFKPRLATPFALFPWRTEYEVLGFHCWKGFLKKGAAALG